MRYIYDFSINIMNKVKFLWGVPFSAVILGFLLRVKSLSTTQKPSSCLATFIMGGYQCSLHFLKPSLAFVEKVNRGKNNYFLKLLSTSWVNQPEPIKRHFQLECFPAAIFGPNRPFESGDNVCGTFIVWKM